MIDSARLLTDLKAQLKLLEADLRARAEDQDHPWGASLREEHGRATARERTGLSWIDWRDGQVAQAAVAWIIATVFIRFGEDNDLLEGVTLDAQRIALPWLAGPGDRIERAVENQSAYYSANPTAAGPDWLRTAFAALASLPSGRALVDPDHSLVWSAPISGEAADALVDFWRRTDANDKIMHDFTDPDLDTRFLGDLYQDLSEFAKKQYALLQTPVFVEEFILDQTLTPAIAEFGLDGLKLIDPTCGSGHFLLGAFDRLVTAWSDAAPALDARQRVAKALESVHGVDLNPFAIAIARFRLTVAALRAAGDRSLVGAPEYKIKLAIGDSLLASQASSVKLDIDDETYEYPVEDVAEYAGILARNQYHVVVGNPPYITVKDPALNALYRELYKTCHRQYALSVPFMELFFELARRADSTSGAGYVGKITSNSFMKREFGKKLIEQFLSGLDPMSPVDLNLVFDSAGAWIQGHNFDGTPTVVLIGRRRAPIEPTVLAIQSVKEDAGKPPAGSVSSYWMEAVSNFKHEGFLGEYVSVSTVPRQKLARHPWSLAGGGASSILEQIESRGSRLARSVHQVGFMGMTHIDDLFIAPRRAFERRGVEMTLVRPLVAGDAVRDNCIGAGDSIFFPYDRDELVDIQDFRGADAWLWPARAESWNRATFGRQSYRQDGRTWWEWHQVGLDRVGGLTIAFAEVATHNHFVLDRHERIFKQAAPVIKLTPGASDEQYLALLSVLNSSTVCFWLKQVTQKKGGDADVPWLRTYQFNATSVENIPLPPISSPRRGEIIELLSAEIAGATSSSIIQGSDKAKGDLSEQVLAARARWSRLRARLIFEQEEVDWEVYRLYGLTDEDLTYGGMLDQLQLGQRAFEIALARRVAAGEEETAWFERHGSTPITELPDEWPDDYRALVQRRLQVIVSDPSIRLLERPEYKRRWATRSWDDQLADAVRDALLDHLETPSLWVDASGRPVTRTVNELADLLRTDAWFGELAALSTGSADVDLRVLIGSLMVDEAVPHLAALRYKPSGMEKFHEWERTWELQRAEDRGEKVNVPVPSKYAKTDFRQPSYWKARGKLDVPKERFIAYPGTNHPNDASAVYGWAGWDHADRAQALARLANDLSIAGASADDLAPLIGGLLELQPWLTQWHSDVDPTIGISPADAIHGLTEQLLQRHGLTRDTVTSWQPPAPTRGRAASKGTR